MIQQKLFRTTPIIPILLLVLLIGMAPFLTALFDSFFHDYYGERSFAGMENFRYILEDRGFPYSLNITVLWALTNVVLSLVFGFLLALRLVSSKKNTGNLYKTLLIPWGIPVYIAIPLWRAFLHGNGGESVIFKLTGIQINLMIDPLSGFLGALAVSLWLSIPLSAFVFSGHMRKVSKQVLEAAKLDGAGEGEIALYIYIPEIRESILAMGVLNFIKAFKEFTLVFMMTAGGPPLISGITDRHIIGATTTLGVFLYEIFLHTGDWGVNAAYSIVMGFLIIFIMTLWILIKKESSVKPFLILSALAQIPGGVPVLWLFSGGYLLSVFKPGLTTWLCFIQSIFIIFRIWEMGFLAGFHPGILIPLLTVAVILIKKRQNKILRPNPLYRWKGLGIRNFLSPKAMTITSGILALLYTAVTGIILYMLLWMSLAKTSVSYVDSFLPAMASLDNYRIIFLEEGILKYFLNTFIIAGLTAVLLPVLIFPGAVWLNKLGRTKTLALLGFLQILGIAGGMHSLIPLYRIFMKLGLINSYIPLILIYLYHSIPFSLFILTAYLETIPSVFRDMARIEGMSSISYTFRIVLPLSLAPLLSSVMVAFISGWNGFQAALLFLNDEKMYTISLKLYSYVGNLGSGSSVWNLFAAAAVVNTLFIGLLFIRFKNPMEKSPLSESTY